MIARNPDPDSALPWLLRVPLGDGILLKARETWPRTSKVYCHRVDAWPEDAEIVERVPVRSCVRRGAAIDLVLDRSRENRSQLVITQIRGGRQAIFWQTARTAKQARPRVSLPTARGAGQVELGIVVDSHERYAYRFPGRSVSLRKAALPAGDYGVVRDGAVLAVVERKSLADLVSTLTGGRLKYQLTELATVPRAAIVVEDRYAAVYRLDRVRPAVVADGLAECQVAFPTVPVVFADSRKLAEEWTYRFLAAAAAGATLDEGGLAVVTSLATPPPLPPAPASTAEVRAWAVAHGHAVSDRGRIPARVRAAYEEALAATAPADVDVAPVASEEYTDSEE